MGPEVLNFLFCKSSQILSPLSSDIFSFVPLLERLIHRATASCRSAATDASTAVHQEPASTTSVQSQRTPEEGFGQLIDSATMKLRYAMVCSSNQNRSMEAHSLLKREGLDVSSYGTGQHVKLPGPSLREPNVYDFGTPYKQMFDDLRRKDPELYKRNGILPMLKRNLAVKLAPQRWQDNAADGVFDIVLAFEEKVFDMVLEDLHTRNHVLLKPVLVINLEVKDNHEEAAIGAKLALLLCLELEETDSWEESIDTIITNFESKHRRKLLYSVSFY